jgi:hypothetical protein
MRLLDKIAPQAISKKIGWLESNFVLNSFVTRRRVVHQAVLSLCFLFALTTQPSNANASGVSQEQQQAQHVADTVTISSKRNPVEKSYRAMLRGLDAFEQDHALAPLASLRFKLLPRLPDTDMNDITVKILGEKFFMAIEVAKDHRFSLERIAQTETEDASVITNRTAKSLTWRPDIRTPGLPPNTRRLGDLRLECRVSYAAGLISEGRFGVASALGLNKIWRRCDNAMIPVEFMLFADHAIFSVTLIDGDRRLVLPTSWLYGKINSSPAIRATCDCQSLSEKTYGLLLNDKTWSDETLVEFENMIEADSLPSPIHP